MGYYYNKNNDYNDVYTFERLYKCNVLIGHTYQYDTL